jgi:hypothetical protein
MRRGLQPILSNASSLALWGKMLCEAWAGQTAAMARAEAAGDPVRPYLARGGSFLTLENSRTVQDCQTQSKKIVYLY